DAAALGAFIERQYQDAKVDPDEIDTGALILTGVAVRRRNARKIGELFARQAGKMVAVSAGDSLETVMAAHGSGAVARSIRDNATVMNVDVGGGTSKIAIRVGEDEDRNGQRPPYPLAYASLVHGEDRLAGRVLDVAGPHLLDFVDDLVGHRDVVELLGHLVAALVGPGEELQRFGGSCRILRLLVHQDPRSSPHRP